MANEKVNKVVLGNETLIDLTSDTVNENNLLAGATAHDASGEQVRGAVTVPTELDDLSDVDAGSPSNGDVLFNNGSDWVNKNIHPEVTYAEYKAMEQAGTLDPNVEYFVSDMNVANVPIDDSTTSASKVWSSQKVSRELTNAHKTTTKEVAITGWTSDTTSQSGTTLYKKTISLSHVYVDSPSVDIGASGVLPTSAQQEAYNLLQYVTIDGTTLTLYASEIPTTAFYIKITGVD